MAGQVGNQTFVTRFKFCNEGQRWSPQSATCHIANRCASCEKSQRANRHIWFLPTHKPIIKNQKSLFFCPRSDEPTS